MIASIVTKVIFGMILVGSIHASVVSEGIYWGVESPREIHSSVKHKAPGVTAEGNLYDLTTGAFLYDAVTGAPLMA